MTAPITTATSLAPKIIYAANPPVNVEAHRRMIENTTKRILSIGKTPNCHPGEVQYGGASFSRSGSLSPDDQRDAL
jgi:hypothetical protein